MEEWKTQLDENKIVGAVLLDLSKAFDCIPHDLLITKLNACGFDKVLSLICSYLKNRKHVCINNVYSTFLELISGVPQGSVLRALLSNIFLNDLYMLITKASLHNYADDNTLSEYSSDLNSLIDILIKESQTSINWFKANDMIVNPKRISSNEKTKTPEDFTICINDVDIKSKNSVKLFSAGIYMLKANWRRSGFFIVNFEHISHLVLVFLLLTLNM